MKNGANERKKEIKQEYGQNITHKIDISENIKFAKSSKKR